MRQELIFYPLFIMVALSFSVGIYGMFMRYRAVVRDGLRLAYFKHNSEASPPDYMLRTDQNYSNQFELPVLFYAAIMLCFLTSSVDLLSLALAWLFVISRLGHSYVHIRFNKVMQRRRYFLFGYFVLLALWFKLVIQLSIR